MWSCGPLMTGFRDHFVCSCEQRKKDLGCLGYIRDDILPRYIVIAINHCKDPYEPTRISWRVVRVFFFVRGSCHAKFLEPTCFFAMPSCWSWPGSLCWWHISCCWLGLYARLSDSEQPPWRNNICWIYPATLDSLQKCGNPGGDCSWVGG